MLIFGRLIGLRVRNPAKLILYQMNFSNSRYSSRNGWRDQYWQNARFVFESCDFHVLSLFIFLPYMYRKVWMLAFQFHWNHLISTSRAQALHKTSTGGQICQLSSIYFFLNISSKSVFKTQNKEYQGILYIKHRQNTRWIWIKLSNNMVASHINKSPYFIGLDFIY